MVARYNGGFFDGLTFDFVRPHVEIRTSLRDNDDGPRFTNEIDAQSLGLDQQRIKTSAEAASVLQREIAPAFQAVKKRGSPNNNLQEYMKQWQESFSADFLIGRSRKEVNEALGYSYRRGLKSLPVTRGAVALQPISPRESSAQLVIFLADVGQRTGRWMVVGSVVSGLEVADEIARRPLAGCPKARFEPRDPVVITAVTASCSEDLQDTASTGGSE